MVNNKSIMFKLIFKLLSGSLNGLSKANKIELIKIAAILYIIELINKIISNSYLF